MPLADRRAGLEGRLGPCKGKDTSTTLGPWLVTADELEPYRDADGFLDLELTAAVNGAQVGHDRLSHMGGPSRTWSPTPPAEPG
jgi:2-keto-4-pentenoate hydratase/2-oxohepta-3-ene-1,7-dioic acid hydratase in catechol pathway